MDQEPNNTSRIPLLIIGGVAAVLVFGIVLLIQMMSRGGQGAVAVWYSVQDTKNAAVRFNGTAAKLAADSTYHLPSGKYTLKISKPGYADFSTGFTLAAGQTKLINAQLHLEKPPIVDNTKQLSLYQGMAGATLTKVDYFYEHTWAVATISAPSYEGAVVVVEYDANTGAWATVLGPGVSFQQSDISQLPILIQNYLRNAGHAAGE